MSLLKSEFEAELNEEIPDFGPGDTVDVHVRIIEGNKERIQVFTGVVICRHAGKSPEATFTVRKTQKGFGVERIFPLHSPKIEKLVIRRQGLVRRAKLYYLRSRSGKAARIRERATNR
jgi:large subunit ribosomal protein L19